MNNSTSANGGPRSQKNDCPIFALILLLICPKLVGDMIQKNGLSKCDCVPEPISLMLVLGNYDFYICLEKPANSYEDWDVIGLWIVHEKNQQLSSSFPLVPEFQTYH